MGYYLVFVVWVGKQCHAACGILVPSPGTEPVPPVLEAPSLNHWTTREAPKFGLLSSVPYSRARGCGCWEQQ